MFSGELGTVSFGGAVFSGGQVDFGYAEFFGSEVIFDNAEFTTGGTVNFSRVAGWSHPPLFDWKGTPPAGVRLPEGIGGESQ